MTLTTTDLHPAQMALERDRTRVAQLVSAIRHTLGNYRWLLDGRGSYEWGDDRYRQEFVNVCALLERDLAGLAGTAADWSNCPKKTTDVQMARRGLELRSRLEALLKETRYEDSCPHCGI
jgi:hypothetical protein